MDMEGPHWAFSLAVYGRAGVPEACLRLQDRLALDVNVLLLALFVAGTRNAVLTGATIAAADAEIAGWRGEVVTALRRLRVLLKDGPPGAPRPPADELRTGIKTAELLSEQIEQAWLADWFARHLADGRPAVDRETLRTAARRVAGLYAGRSGIGEIAPDLLACADHVAQAAHEELVRTA